MLPQGDLEGGKENDDSGAMSGGYTCVISVGTTLPLLLHVHGLSARHRRRVRVMKMLSFIVYVGILELKRRLRKIMWKEIDLIEL